MFGFFTALFGGAYIAHKRSVDKRADQQLNNYLNNVEDIERRLRNLSYEKHLRTIAQDKTGKYDEEKQELLKSIEPELNEIMMRRDALEDFNDPRKSIYLEVDTSMGFKTLWEMTINLLMAKEGYICHDTFHTCMPLFQYDENSKYFCGKACRKMEEFLIKAHPEIPLEQIKFYRKPIPYGSIFESCQITFGYRIYCTNKIRPQWWKD